MSVQKSNIAAQATFGEAATSNLDATGRSVNIGGVQIRKFADGKQIQRWGSGEALGLPSQGGLVQL